MTTDTTTDTTTEQTADELLAAVTAKAATLTEARDYEAEERRKAAAMIEAAERVVATAQDDVDATRRLLLRAHADIWRERAAVLRAEAEETPAEETVTMARIDITGYRSPMLVFARDELTRQAGYAEEQARRLATEGREPEERSSEAGLVRPAKTWIDGVFGEELAGAVARSLAELENLDDDA